MFFRFNRLMQSFVVTASVQNTSCMFVNDKNFSVSYDVILIAHKQIFCFQSIVQITDKRRVLGFVEIVDAEIIFNLRNTGIQNSGGLAFLVDFIIFVASKFKHKSGKLGIPAGNSAFRRSGNNQRSSSFVDKNRINLIDDGKTVSALNQVFAFPCHVVAQIIKTELVIGSVSHVCAVLLIPFDRILLCKNAS